jgi:flagellar hook assembly protein FlgD
MRDSRVLKRRTILFLSGGLLLAGVGLGAVQTGWAVVETVKTFGLVETGALTETATFNDGSVVYVRVNVGAQAGSSSSSVTITDYVDSGNTITITVYDNGYLPDDNNNDTYYWGKFTLRQGDGTGTSDTNDILELSDGETAKIEANLDGDGQQGELTITAGYSTFTDFSSPFMTFSVDPSTFSPDGDGVQDNTTISFTLDDNVSSSLETRLEIRDNTSNYVIKRNLLIPSSTDNPLSTGSHSYTWDGKDDDGNYVSDDTYVAYLISVDGAENSAQRTANIVVETTVPEITDVMVSPSTISPENGDENYDISTITFKATNTGADLTFKIYAEPDCTTLLRDLTSSIQAVAGNDHYSVTWNGKNENGSYVDDGEYICQIYAESLAGEQTWNTDGTVTVDNTVPSSPTNLSATALTGAGIKLTWTASSSSDVAQYNIYRATSSGGQNYSSPNYQVSTGTTAYTDTSTTNGQTYYYVVRAQDAAGNIETNANEVSATASGVTPPPAPTNLTATAIVGGSIQLTWTASSPETNVAQYNIYRATTSGGEDYSSPTYTVSAGTTSYTDTSTTDGVTYYYVVRAQDSVGNIETNTNEASATASTTGSSFSSICADKSAYRDGDTITLTVTLTNHDTGCTLTANFSNIDDQYVSGGESVVNWGTDGVDNNDDGHKDEPAEQGIYIISYLISLVNTRSDGSHNVSVTATDAASNSTTSSISLSLDNTAPPAPTNLSATAIAGGAIKLTWSASSPETDVAQYNIYRATTSGGEDYSSPTYTVSAGIITYTNTSTTNGQIYYYVVRAQDAAGNIETNTNEVSATASGTGPPAPTNLTATAIARGNIQLTWTASSPETNVAQYNIYRATSSGGQNYNSPLANVSAGTTTYTDSSTTDGVTYYYVVRAQDAAGNIETNTNEASATADATTPPAPTNLSATAIAGGSIRLTWTASSPETNVAKYNIYRATTSGGEDYSSPTYIVSVGTTTYTDTSTTDGVTYYYVVRAQDAAGNIETNINEVSATAGFVSTVSQIYIKYQGALLYNLVFSTNRHNPGVFASGDLDEIYLKINLLTGSPFNESTSSIALYKVVDSETQEISGSQETNYDTAWAELIFCLDSAFNPDVDEHSRDGLYWVDAIAVDTAGNTNNLDFYFIYDTTSPSPPKDIKIASFDSPTGSVTVSGTTVPDELSDPQWVEIFVNDSSKGAVTADANYEFVKSGIELIKGANYIAGQSTDKAGNKSEFSKSLKLNYNPESLLSIVFRSPHVVRSGSSTEPVKIIYSVTQPAEINIQIFNVRGEIVKEWSGSASPGEETKWNWYGRNMYEEEVNNGVYIFRIKAKAGSGENDSSTKLVGVLR